MAYNRNSGARTFSSRSYSSPGNKMSVSRVNSAYFPGNRTGPSGISASWATPVSSAGILLSNPPNTEIDPRFHQIKTQEKEEIKGLNNKFADFINKDVDEGYLQKVDLENTVESLMDELAFLKQLYDEEIRELQSQINNTAVTVEMDNNRGLDMKQIVEEVKMQYEGIAMRGRDEAEQWYKNKVDDMAAEAGKYNQDLKGVKNEIAEMMRLIQRLNSEAEGLKNRRANLEMAIGEAEERGQLAVSDAKNRVSELEAALKSAKQAMAKQVREYQDLMNLKLALEIEIATYRKLLEGEESRASDSSTADAPGSTMTKFYPSTSCRRMLPPQDKHLLCVKCLGMQHSSSALDDEIFCSICAVSQPRTLHRRLAEFTGAASSASSAEPSAALGAPPSPFFTCLPTRRRVFPAHRLPPTEPITAHGLPQGAVGEPGTAGRQRTFQT
ncbi:UNVERIFIED_CONTAM: hypothetical protein FKN15_017748 [Acipenser sinensis]